MLRHLRQNPGARPSIGDVGHDLRELIELSSKGANHGWSGREGSHAFLPNRPRPHPLR
ncbi:MAG: hypothetical protein NTX13_14595 [Acidobacteria bacterium]|nr:hypothetical protein [Acidobacteriota bacterium]